MKTNSLIYNKTKNEKIYDKLEPMTTTELYAPDLKQAHNEFDGVKPLNMFVNTNLLIYGYLISWF